MCELIGEVAGALVLPRFTGFLGAARVASVRPFAPPA